MDNIFNKFSNQDLIDCSICKFCTSTISYAIPPGSSDKVTGHKKYNSYFCSILERCIEPTFNGVCENFISKKKCKCGGSTELNKNAYKFLNMTNKKILLTSLVCCKCQNNILMNISENNIENLNNTNKQIYIIER